MKAQLQNIVKPEVSPAMKKNVIREYLQEYVLYLLYRKKFYTVLIFCGGTALRFIYGIRRFSEDLDFSLSDTDNGYDFEKMLKVLKNELILAGYSVEVRINTAAVVHNSFLRFSDLLYEYGISRHKSEKISIKIEIDTHPPGGGTVETSVRNKNHLFYLRHYTLNSLFAGKIHALLCRPYTKGRDWYDLFWYLTKFPGIQPDLNLLNNAIHQTHPAFVTITPENWKSLLKKAVKSGDMDKARDDVWRFLEDPEETRFLTKAQFNKILKTVDEYR